MEGILFCNSSLTNTEEQCQCNLPPRISSSALYTLAEPRSEVEDDAGDGLEVVLVLAEEGVEHVIAFGPQ